MQEERGIEKTGNEYGRQDALVEGKEKRKLKKRSREKIKTMH